MKVSKEKIIQLCKKHNLKPIKISLLKDKDSYVNTLYKIQTKEQDYIVKITNPLPKWKSIKTKAEVHAIQNIKNVIPTPNIIDYSTTKKQLGYEFILYEMIPGTSLNKVYDKSSNTEKKEYLKQIIQILKKLKKHKYNQIGSFTNNKIAKVANNRTGPHKDWQTDIKSQINQYLKEMKNTQFAHLIPKFKNKLKTIPKTKIPITFCHGDLNLKNFIVNNKKITGLIDFEWSGAFPYTYDMYNIENKLQLNEQKDFFFKQLQRNKIRYKIPKKIQDMLELERMAMRLVSYQSWFTNKKEAEKFIQTKLKELKTFI